MAKSKTNADDSLQRPTRGVNNPYELIAGKASAIQNQILQESDPEKAQALKRELDIILKDVADLQSKLGRSRISCSSHIASLRRSSPKTKPVEGDVRLINGENCVFLGGKFYPVAKPEGAKPEEKS